VDDVRVVACAAAAEPRPLRLPLISKGGSIQALQVAGATPLVDAGLPERPAGLSSLVAPLRAAQQVRLDALAVDTLHRRVLSASGAQVLARDAVTGAELWSRYLTGNVARLVVRDATGETLALLPGQGELQLLSAAGEVQAIVGHLGRPTNAVEGDGWIYVADSGANRVLQLDAQTWAVRRAAQFEEAPYALAYDARTGRLYVGLMGSGQVLALAGDDLATLAGVRLRGLGLPQDLAVDTVAGRVYVAHALTPKYGALTVLDAATLAVVAERTGTADVSLLGSDAVRVDAARNALYLAQSAGCLVLDPDTLTFRETITLQDRLVSGLALDALDGTLFLGGAAGELWTWRAGTP
ncbi:MAG: hypothetical protein GX557_08025, partial [Chloroflexi bacterium]|nr:hypothetical protein [Chloroflexota bacterium]